MSLYLGENKIADNTCSRNIGEIIQSTIPLSDAGLHLLDGALISGAGSYAKFVNYIAGLVSNYPDLFTTEANWQSSVSTYGVCGKFVYDSVNNTVRLPKYSNKIYTGGGTAPVKGNGMTLGLTDGTNYFGISGWDGNSGDISKDPDHYGTNLPFTRTGGNKSNKGLGVTTDASKSGIIADLSNITTALEGYYYIVIATSVKTQIEVDIDEVMTDLNGKADVDLSNVSNTSGFRKLVKLYKNGASWYKVFREYDPSTGNLIGLWCEQGGSASAGANNIALLKQFGDTNYTILLTAGRPSNFGGDYTPQYYNKTTAGFVAYFDSESTSNNWEAKGYIS